MRRGFELCATCQYHPQSRSRGKKSRECAALLLSTRAGALRVTASHDYHFILVAERHAPSTLARYSVGYHRRRQQHGRVHDDDNSWQCSTAEAKLPLGRVRVACYFQHAALSSWLNLHRHLQSSTHMTRRAEFGQISLGLDLPDDDRRTGHALAVRWSI